MSVEETPTKFKNERRRRRRRGGGSCSLSSCFSGSPVYESANELESSSASRQPRQKRAEEASCSSWSWLRKKKKTVPVTAAGAPVESARAAAEDIGEKETLHKKHTSKSNRPNGNSMVIVKDKQQPEQAANINTGSQGTTSLPRISVKYDARSQLQNLVRTRTRTRHVVGSSEPNQLPVPDEKSDHQRANLDHLVGLSVLVVTLAVMLVWGCACAVGCLCACFYLVPLLRMTTVTDGNSTDRGNTVELDLESEAYKKKVVLEGLLERNGRRLSGINSFKPPTTSLQ